MRRLFIGKLASDASGLRLSENRACSGRFLAGFCSQKAHFGSNSRVCGPCRPADGRATHWNRFFRRSVVAPRKDTPGLTMTAPSIQRMGRIQVILNLFDTFVLPEFLKIW